MRFLFLLLFILLSLSVFGQSSPERILYIVDSIPIIEEPKEDEGTLKEEDIETLTIITNKDEIEKQGYSEIDKIFYIITKPYSNRSDELKRIPSTKQMVRKGRKWYLKGSDTPYSGKFIDYYFNGKKQGDGVFKAGLVEGRRNVFFQNGNLDYFRYYVNGIENGESKEYFQNGKIHQAGLFQNGKDDGVWKEWYSTGELKRETEFRDGKAILTKLDEKFHSFFSKGIQLFNSGNYKAAIKSYNKALEINPNYSDLYFHRSRAYLYEFDFEKSLLDCDKAIDLEPLYKEAYSNRAFVRLRKYEMGNSRVLHKNSEVTVLASSDKVDIPKLELEKMCFDLNMGYQLGDRQAMILDAIKTYCE